MGLVGGEEEAYNQDLKDANPDVVRHQEGYGWSPLNHVQALSMILKRLAKSLSNLENEWLFLEVKVN